MWSKSIKVLNPYEAVAAGLERERRIAKSEKTPSLFRRAARLLGRANKILARKKAAG